MHEKSILLVDDEEIILNSIGMDLRQENYEVTLAGSAEEAMPLLKNRLFDLVITDLSMPGLDGLHVLRAVKKINSLTGVIILTGHGDMTSAIEALRLGADDYLLKPCGTDELLLRAARCFEIVRMKRAEEEMKELLQTQSVLYRLLTLTEGNISLQESLERFLDYITSFPWLPLNAAGVVFLFEDDLETLVLQAAKGVPGCLEAMCKKIKKGQCLCGRAATGEVVFFCGEDNRHEIRVPWMRPHAHYCLPIRSSEGEILGAFSVYAADRCKREDKIEETLLAASGALAVVLKLKKAEEALRASRDLLESRVLERTAELENTNTALNVLLKKRELDQRHLQEQVLCNLKQFVSPYLEKIKRCRPTSALQTNLDIIESNLKAITSSFSVDFSSIHYRLSPTELQVANLISLGKASKEIAVVMNLSIETIHNHRKHIRKKLGITKKTVKLQRVLSRSMDDFFINEI